MAKPIITTSRGGVRVGESGSRPEAVPFDGVVTARSEFDEMSQEDRDFSAVRGSVC